jgi:hypothetical protein
VQGGAHKSSASAVVVLAVVWVIGVAVVGVVVDFLW